MNVRFLGSAQLLKASDRGPQCVLGDGIIAWRAWVLWNRNRMVLIGPTVLLVGALGAP